MFIYTLSDIGNSLFAVLLHNINTPVLWRGLKHIYYVETLSRRVKTNHYGHDRMIGSIDRFDIVPFLGRGNFIHFTKGVFFLFKQNLLKKTNASRAHIGIRTKERVPKRAYRSKRIIINHVGGR